MRGDKGPLLTGFQGKKGITWSEVHWLQRSAPWTGKRTSAYVSRTGCKMTRESVSEPGGGERPLALSQSGRIFPFLSSLNFWLCLCCSPGSRGGNHARTRSYKNNLGVKPVHARVPVLFLWRGHVWMSDLPWQSGPSYITAGREGWAGVLLGSLLESLRAGLPPIYFQFCPDQLPVLF